MDFDKFCDMAIPFVKEAVKRDLDLKKIAQMVKQESKYFRIFRHSLTSLRKYRSMMCPCTHTRK